MSAACLGPDRLFLRLVRAIGDLAIIDRYAETPSPTDPLVYRSAIIRCTPPPPLGHVRSPLRNSRRGFRHTLSPVESHGRYHGDTAFWPQHDLCILTRCFSGGGEGTRTLGLYNAKAALGRASNPGVKRNSTNGRRSASFRCAVITWRTDHSARHGPSCAATASIPGLESIQLTHVSCGVSPT